MNARAFSRCWARRNSPTSLPARCTRSCWTAASTCARRPACTGCWRERGPIRRPPRPGDSPGEEETRADGRRTGPGMVLGHHQTERTRSRGVYGTFFTSSSTSTPGKSFTGKVLAYHENGDSRRKNSSSTPSRPTKVSRRPRPRPRRPRHLHDIEHRRRTLCPRASEIDPQPFRPHVSNDNPFSEAKLPGSGQGSHLPAPTGPDVSL